MNILVLNSGSSTQKSALFDLGPEGSTDPIPPVWEGKLEWNGSKETLVVRNDRARQIREQNEIPGQDTNPPASVERMLGHLWTGPAAVLQSPEAISAVGHRVVHGGAKLIQSTVVDAAVKRSLAELSNIAPLHNRAALRGIMLAEKLFPQAQQVAVFDTAFHRTLPLPAVVYPGPYEWYEHGIRRYGFHGINHQYCAQRAARMLGREISSLKMVTCHLGNGCSLAAIDSGRSVDTTMGFTPIEGLMMGTRPGSVDPGILTYLMRTESFTAGQLEDKLNHQSGLLGISGVSGDMREVLNTAAGGNERAKLAFEIFIHRLRTGIAAMAASLGGLDVLVFSAGIGENSAEVRRAACERLAFLGIQLDHARNSAASPDMDIGEENSRIRVLVIRAQEDWTIAQECAQMMSRLRA